MSKKEKIFHDKDEKPMGARIQKLRKERGYRREELHDLVYKRVLKNDSENKDDSESAENGISPESKYRTVYNWESGASVPSYDILNALCDVLGCDSDYLLGRQNNPLQIYDYIEDITHLSRGAIDNIYDASKDFLNVLNFILENPLLIKQIEHCVTVKYELQKIPITQNANNPFRIISSEKYVFVEDRQLFQADLMNTYNILVQCIQKLRTDKGLKIYESE